MRFHHVGIITEDADSELQKFRYLFREVKNVKSCFDPFQEAELRFFELGNLNVELVDSRKSRSLLRRGIKIYHLCFEVKDLEEKLKELISAGCMLITPPTKATLFEGKKVCFLATPMGFLLELLEQTDE